MLPRRGTDTLTPDIPMNPPGFDGRELAGGSVKRKEWIPFVSLGVFMAVMNLTIAGFGFERINRLEVRMDRLEARIDRIEERLSSLEQRVSRIEGVLMIRVDRADAGALPPDGGSEPPKGWRFRSQRASWRAVSTLEISKSLVL